MLNAFLINLDRSPDRLAHMRQEFDRIGVEFVRVPAVDASLMSKEELTDFARIHTHVYPRRWRPGEIGCFLSHLGLWRRVAAGDAAFAAIFEDDVHLAADLTALLGATGWIPPDADIVRLEANKKMLLEKGSRIEGVSRRNIHKTISDTWGSGGYIVSREAARRLIAVAPEFHCWVDVFLFHPGWSPVAACLRTYQVVPAVCVQDHVHDSREARFGSEIVADRRGPSPAATSWTPLERLLPWRRQSILFRP